MQTLEIAKQLKKVGIEETHAYEMAEAINGKSGLATKEDLHEVRTEIHNVEKNLEGQIHAVKEDIGKLETSNKWIVAILFIMFGMMIKLFIDSFQ